MEIRCPNCQKIFKADSQQKLLTDTARKNNQRLIFIECPKCLKYVPINPNNLLSKTPQKDKDNKNESVEVIKSPYKISKRKKYQFLSTAYFPPFRNGVRNGIQ